MIRKATVMRLYPGKLEEYRRRHNPIWSELEAELKSHGAHNYGIFHHPKTNQLFAYVELEDEERWDAIARTDACRRWWAFMAELMETNPDNSPVSDDLNEVFYLE